MPYCRILVDLRRRQFLRGSALSLAGGTDPAAGLAFQAKAASRIARVEYFQPLREHFSAHRKRVVGHYRSEWCSRQRCRRRNKRVCRVELQADVGKPSKEERALREALRTYLLNKRNSVRLNRGSQKMEEANAILALGALGQSIRLKTVGLLIRHEPMGMPAGDIARELAVPQSTMSSHLNTLSHAGLVRSERHSRLIIYRALVPRLRELTLFLIDDCCGGRTSLHLSRLVARFGENPELKNVVRGGE